MPILMKVNHRLESRMREIRQSGSEGGATESRPYPYESLGRSPISANLLCCNIPDYLLAVFGHE